VGGVTEEELVLATSRLRAFVDHVCVAIDGAEEDA